MLRLPSSTALLISLALFCVHVTVGALSFRQAGAAAVPLPNDAVSFKFAVLGDSGTGDKAQYELGEQMAALRERFDFRTVILLGNNVQGRERPQDFVSKFESPYRRLIEKGVAFRAVLGSGDSREQRYYKLFNMNGKLYYTFSPRQDIQFFALESTYTEPAQMQWLEDQLKQSSSAWKIAVLHHPLYSSGRRHGSDVTLRNKLEPLFLEHNVSVVFSGRDNVYERITPQNGIWHFVVGAGGRVRKGDINRTSGLTASGFDTDLSFLAAEIHGDRMTFNAISRTGQIVDSGRVLHIARNR